MPARFWSYENRRARRQREAEEWRARARQHVFEALARRRVEQAGFDPDTISSLPVPITTDVSDVGEPIPPTRKEKKTGGSLFSRVMDVAGDVTETVFRGPVRKPWDVLRPATQALQWEEEKIGRPLFKGVSAALTTPARAIAERTSPQEAFRRTYGEMEELPGWAKVVGGIVFSPSTWVPFGLATKALKSSALAAKIPVLSALFRSRGSRAAFSSIVAEGKLSEVRPAISALDEANLIMQTRFLDDDPVRVIKVLKGQSSAISRARNTLGRVLPDSFVEGLDRKGVRLLDTDAVYFVMDWKEGVGEFATSLPAMYREHMGIALSKGFTKETLAFKDGATRILNLPGEPTLNDVIQNFNKYKKVLTPQQQAAIMAARHPWEVIEELSRRYGLPIEKWPKGFYAHRQVLERIAETTDPLSLREYEKIVETRPLVAGGVGAKQAVSKPRVVVSEAEGLRHGVVKYAPWLDAQEIGMRQRLTEIFDQRLLNTYGKIEPETLMGVEAAAATIAKFKKVERELLAFKKRPWKGVFSVRGLADDPWFNRIRIQADVMAGLSKKPDRIAMADELLAVVRAGMKETRAAAKGVKGELAAARKLREVGKAEIAELRGGTKSRTLRGIDATINRINNEIRPVMANIDGSMAGIQALFALARQPLSYLKAFHISTTSPAGLEELFESMYRTGQLTEVISLGLKFYSRDDFGEFAIRGVAKIPYIGYPFAVSSRWFSRWGNSVRMLMAKAGMTRGPIQIPGFRGGIGVARPLEKRSTEALGQALSHFHQEIEVDLPRHIKSLRAAGRSTKGGEQELARVKGMAQQISDELAFRTGEPIPADVLSRVGGIKSIIEGRDLMRGINLSTGYVPGNISTLETALMFAPRWFRSQLSLTADAFTKGGRAGGEARKNLIALIATGSAFTYGMNKVLGNETVLDPKDPNFMRIRALGQDISVFGPWDTFVKGLVHGFKDIPGGSLEEGARYMVRSKASPVMGRVYDMLAGETFRGDKLSAESPFETLVSAAKLSTQWAPISVQAAFERGVPTTPAEIAGAGIQFFGTKATPLTAYEKVSMERDDISQNRYGQNWADLEPHQKQDLLDANPNLAYKSRMAAWAERAEMRDYYKDKQEEMDDVLELGEMTPKEWRDSYGDLRNREFGALEQWEERHPDEAKDLISEDSDDPNYRALAQYYQAFKDSKTPWGALDSESLDIAMAQLEARWTPSQQAFVERNTGIYGTAKVKEYKQDQRKLRPYWELREQVWAKMQKAYSKLMPYRSLVEYINAMSQQMQLSGLAPEAIQQRIARLPIIAYLERIVDTLRERYRLAHPGVDTLLLKWGYISTPIERRTRRRSGYSSIIGR